ncbi:hypothetical protein BSKO_02845 [Bryopsis sp. KO-2023]|nr:hypothetical protein BSKO_02845 [Bryopsis sp. KO-2023]
MGNLISCIWTPSEGPAPSTAELKWDLPEGVLCRIFDLLRVKQLERCCSVTKRWRTLILENHDLKLERAWRMGKIEPKRSNFNFKGHKICKSAKQGDMIAVDGILFSGDDEIGIVRVWDVPELVQRSLLKIPEKVVDVVDASEHVAVCGSHGLRMSHKQFAWKKYKYTIQVWDADEDRCIRTIQLGNGYMINDGYLRGVYLTADKLTVVNTKGEVLQFDFGSMDE